MVPDQQRLLLINDFSNYSNNLNDCSGDDDDLQTTSDETLSSDEQPLIINHSAPPSVSSSENEPDEEGAFAMAPVALEQERTESYLCGFDMRRAVLLGNLCDFLICIFYIMYFADVLDKHNKRYGSDGPEALHRDILYISLAIVKISLNLLGMYGALKFKCWPVITALVAHGIQCCVLLTACLLIPNFLLGSSDNILVALHVAPVLNAGFIVYSHLMFVAEVSTGVVSEGKYSSEAAVERRERMQGRRQAYTSCFVYLLQEYLKTLANDTNQKRKSNTCKREKNTHRQKRRVPGHHHQHRHPAQEEPEDYQPPKYLE